MAHFCHGYHRPGEHENLVQFQLHSYGSFLLPCGTHLSVTASLWVTCFTWEHSLVWPHLGSFLSTLGTPVWFDHCHSHLHGPFQSRFDHTFMAQITRSWLISVTCRNTAVWFGYTFTAHYCHPMEHSIGSITNGTLLSCLETDLCLISPSLLICDINTGPPHHSLADAWTTECRYIFHLFVWRQTSVLHARNFIKLMSSCVLVALFFKVHFKDNLW